MVARTRDALLQHQDRFDAKINRVSEDMRDLRSRLTRVEIGLGGVSRRLGRVDMRIDHIERRFDLTDAPH